MDDTSATPRLLGGADGAPVHQINVDGPSPFLLTCDHYGRLIPSKLGNLGLSDDELARHIAFDIGIAGVAERLSHLLDAHLIAQRYSRLVIDCNRPLEAVSSIPARSEATAIPANEGLSSEQIGQRRHEIFEPYHGRIAEVIDERAQTERATVLVSLHSFTPAYDGLTRPWHIGALYHHDKTLPPLLLQYLAEEADIVVGDNKPYAVSDLTDYTIPVHGEVRGLINTGIEIRQDLITDHNGQREWAERLARVLGKVETALRGQGLV